MSSDKATEVKKEAIEKEIHSQPIESQGILEEVAHIGGRIAGAAKNTAVGVKDAVVAAGGLAKEKAVAAKDYVVGKETVHHDGQRDWFHDTGVDKAEVMEERKHVLGDSAIGFDKKPGGFTEGLTPDQGLHTSVDQRFTTEKKLDQGVHPNLDQAFTTEKQDVQDVMKGIHETDQLGAKKEFSSGLGDTALDQRDALGGFRDKYVMDGIEKKEGLRPHVAAGDGDRPSWFQDTGVDKKEVMEERKTVLGDSFDKPEAKSGKHEAIEKREGFQGRDTGMDGRHDWFADTGVDKNEVMEERRAVLGERNVLGERSDTLKERFDNTSNTVANKAGQLKETVSIKAGQLKDSAFEKGGQLKDAAVEKGAQLKDAAVEKGAQLKDAAGQWKDAAADKAYQLKDSAMDKGQQLKEATILKGQQTKESALETGDQLKGKAIDAGHAVQEKGIALKAAHDKGFVEQEARADKENVRH